MTKTWHNRYHFAFTSIHGDRYDVYIQSEDAPQQVTELIAGESPVQVETDDDENILLSVRGSSGYMRIIHGYDKKFINDLTGYSSGELTRRVVVMRGTVAVWQGFISQEVVDIDIDGSMHELEINIESCLSVLKKLRPDSEYRANPFNVAEIINMALDAASYDIEQGFVYSSLAMVQDVLLSKVQYEWMKDSDEIIKDETLTIRHVITMRTYYDIINELLRSSCACLTENFGTQNPGIVLHLVPTSGESGSFTTPDMYVMNTDQMRQYINGHVPTGRLPQRAGATLSVSDILSNKYPTTSFTNYSDINKQSLIQPLDKFNVIGNVDRDGIPKIFDPKYINWGGFGDLARVEDVWWSATTSQENVSFLQFIDDEHDTQKRGAELCSFQRYQDGNDASQLNSPSPSIGIRGWNRQDITDPVFSYETPALTSDMLSLSMSLINAPTLKYQGDIVFVVRITCGGYYYSTIDNRWVTQTGRTIAQQQIKILMRDGKVPFGDHTAFEEYFAVPNLREARTYGPGKMTFSLPSHLHGNKLKFEIFRVTGLGRDEQVIITGFDIDYANNNLSPNEDEAEFKTVVVCSGNPNLSTEDVEVPRASNPHHRTFAPRMPDRLHAYKYLRQLPRTVWTLDNVLARLFTPGNRYIDTYSLPQGYYFLLSHSVDFKTGTGKAKLIGFYQA